MKRFGGTIVKSVTAAFHLFGFDLGHPHYDALNQVYSFLAFPLQIIPVINLVHSVGIFQPFQNEVPHDHDTLFLELSNKGEQFEPVIAH